LEVRGLGRQLGLARRLVQPADRLAPAGEAFAGQPGGVLPLRQVGRARLRLDHEAADGAGRKPGRGGIDRLQFRHLGGLVRGDDVVRMDHLPAIALVLDPAGDDAPRVDRMALFQLAAEAAEEDQGHEAGVVEHPHAPRLLRSARPLVALDGDQEGHDLAVEGVGDLPLGAADHRVRPQEQHVANDWPRQLLQQRRNARPHAF
jgi:hypothetical protein